MFEIQKRQSFSNAEVEEKITTLEKELSVLSLFAKQDGEQNKPQNEEYWQSRGLNPVLSKSETIYNYLQQTIQPVTAATKRAEILTGSKSQVEQLRSDINYDETHLHHVETEIKSLKVTETKQLLRFAVLVFLVVSGVSDCYVTTDAFRGGGLSAFASLCYGIPVGLAVGLGAGFAATLYMEAKEPKRKIRIFWATISIALIFFAVLGYLRANLYHGIPNISLTGSSEITSTSLFSLTGWELAIASFILFIAGFFFSTATWTSKKDKEQTRKYNRIKNERDQLKKKIETKKREASQISEQALREVSLCTERCEYALAATKRITNIAKTALATYASTNIAYRSDGQCPPYLLEVPEIFFNN